MTWLRAHPHAYSAFIVVLVLGFGLLAHFGLLLVLKRMRIRSITLARRIIWPILFLFFAISFDDALDAAGYSQSWWADELTAAVQSLPVLACGWFLWITGRDHLARYGSESRNDAAIARVILLGQYVFTGGVVLGVILVLLDIWKVNLTPLLASAGMLTVIGATVPRLLGGISIHIDRPYVVGDYVILPTGERGEVINIGLRSTRIRTRDDIIVIVPNAVMTESKVLNESHVIPYTRIRCSLSVSYDSDLDEVERALLLSLKENPLVLEEPRPRVRFRSFGESAILLELLAWVGKPESRGEAMDLMIRGAHKALKNAGIIIPPPQREIFLRGPEGFKNDPPCLSQAAAMTGGNDVEKDSPGYYRPKEKTL